MSALPPKADMCSALGHLCFGPKADSCTAAKQSLFDNLVGTSGKRGGNGGPELFSRDQVNNQVKFGRLLDRNVGRYRSAQNLVDVAGSASKQVRVFCSIGHQTRRFDVVPSPMYCRQSRAQR